MIDQRTILAARNNAELCEAVCRAHGHAGEFHPEIWVNGGTVPRFYPNAVTLSPDPESVRSVLESLCAATPGRVAIKDSFSTLALEYLQFRILFEAQWIYRDPPRIPAGVDAIPCRKIGRNEFTRWERAWSECSGGVGPAIFLPPLLGDDRLAFIAAFESGRIAAGALANRSEGVVGLSNVFCAGRPGVKLIAGILAELGALFPATPVVGYEAGDDLDAFVQLGFQKVGPLRVWIRA